MSQKGDSLQWENISGSQAYLYDVLYQKERESNLNEFEERVESQTQKQSTHQEETPRQHKEDSKKATIRKDKRCKNLPQNISSFCRTIVPKILSKGSKPQSKDCKNRMADFFDQHKASNNQLILMFTYFFMIQEQASESQFLQLKNELNNYLDKRISESYYFDKEERETYIRRININRQLAEKYFDGNSVEIDTEWIKIVCADMFTGRQKNTINKPIEELENIQNSLIGSRNEFLSNPSYHIESLPEHSTWE